MSEPTDMDVQWGGFYASREQPTGPVGVFRLLDFNRYTYHAALYAEKFSGVPSLQELVSLAPFIGHVPVDVRGFLGGPVQLIGSMPLTQSDLEGYMLYLEDCGLTPEERAELESRIIEFSQQPPLRLRLEIVNGELDISEL